MYVCGITPYDATHMECHAATYVAFDLVNRVWRDAGHDVCYVQNVTDVDDPLLERAVASGQDWRTLAASETEAFRADMTALRVLPPRWYIGAVESIPAIAEAVQDLRDRDAVYELEGDLYFPVSADPRFGDVSGLDHATMRDLFAERGGDLTDRANGTRWIRCCGRARDPTNRRGRPTWAKGALAGTSNVRPSPRSTSAFRSTCRGWVRPGVPAPRDVRRHGPVGAAEDLSRATTSTPEWSDSTATR